MKTQAGEQVDNESTLNGPQRKLREAPQNYGTLSWLTDEQYTDMWERQHGKCAICGMAEVKLQVDHDHNTGEVRELLCGHCNRALGQFRDCPNVVRKAVDYLLIHNATITLPFDPRRIGHAPERQGWFNPDKPLRHHCAECNRDEVLGHFVGCSQYVKLIPSLPCTESQ